MPSWCATGRPGHRTASRSWVDASVINAGDGWHEHPTQALLDCYTIRQHLGDLSGQRIAIVGDIKHSRVARSDVWAFTAMGAEVVLVAPPTLLPPSLEGWPVKVSHDLDEVLPTRRCGLPAAHAARAHDRGSPAVAARVHATFGLTNQRVARLRRRRGVMHPGPMNRGVEIAAEVADLPRSLILDQVRNGVAVRMAVLYLLLGAGGPRVPEAPRPAPDHRSHPGASSCLTHLPSS
jgi:aspartate carbamoyltransferase catalytic subunit